MSNNKTVKWKRFSRASYAVFNSLHKQIAIGVLTAAMLQSAGIKASNTTGKGNARFAGNTEARTEDNALLLDTLGIGLDDVEILGTRVPLSDSQAPRMVTVMKAADIKAAAVHSINDLLEYAAGIDVRQRGELGVQTDIAVRGGTFDQVTLLLNGVNISSPHTGHLSADFPVSIDDIERIEVIEGPAARVFGTSAFTGVVNIVTKSAGKEDNGSVSDFISPLKATIHARGGSYGYAAADVRLAMKHQVGGNASFAHSMSGGYARSDGDTQNSFFTNSHLFYQARYTSDKVKVDAQIGYSYKPYGANTFYGLASTDQWESNERLLASVSAETQVGNLHLKPMAYWNRWNDHYQWHRNVSPAGENFHQVDVYALAINSWLDSPIGKTAFGVEMKSDAIWSTNLGRPLEEDEYRNTAGHDGTPDRQYTHYDQRTNISAYIEHNILLRQWTVSLGLLANYNTGLDERWRFYPGIDISYRPTEKMKLFASWNMALRMPTFTDLYYSGTNIEGNSNLKPEKTNDIALGAKYRTTALELQAETFYSHKSDMIDWVVYEDETYDNEGNSIPKKEWIYRSGNFKLDNYGVELNAAVMPRELLGEHSPLRRIAVSYAYISENIAHERPVALSKYAQEYLKHKVVVQADGTIWRNLNISLAWRWQEREGAGNAPYALLDGKLSWDTAAWSAYVDCTNILDKTYYDYSIVRQPGRWFKAGIVMKF